MHIAVETLPDRVAAAPSLARWGRALTAEVLLAVGGQEWLLSIHEGQVARVQPGPFVMPRYAFALRIDPAGLARFLAPVPEPVWQDLLALRRHGALSIEGDTLPFFQHLMWFKGMIALLREGTAAPAPAPVPGPAPAPWGSVTAEPITGRYWRIDIEGRPHRVYVEEAGEGVPLLLLHTAGSDGRQWRDLLNDAEVTRRFRCIAFDMPWHGKSSPPAGWQEEAYRLTTAGYTGLVLRMADALGLERPIVMGCSIGGRIVLDLAAEHPGRWRGVIGLQGSAFTGRYYDLSVLHHPHIHGGEVCGAIVSGLVAPTAPEAARWETLWHYMQGGPGVFRGDLHFYSEEGDLRPRLARIDTARCPVVLMNGDHDYSARPEDARATAAAIPGAEAIIMPGLGHFPMSEDYAALRPHLLPVLEAMAARTG